MVRGSGGLIGRVLLRRYRVVRELAKGGMGVVYLARAEGAGGFVRPVVLKLILPQHAADPRFLGMFVREAKIMSGLRHPSIVPVLEFGEEDGAYVMVLEYIRGYHLGQWQKYLHKQGRSIPPRMLMLLMVDVLEALHNAHSMVHPDGSNMHIVHRDVSPSNILLDEDGRARLLDFGVARMRGGNVEYQTQIQSFVGKFTYGAPELFGGTDATAGSDVYSCGVVLHEMLFGRNCFSASEDAMTLNLVLNHVPEPIEPIRPDAPRGLDKVLQKALEKEPSRRFANAWEFATALRELQPVHEGEVRAQLAAMLKVDFGDAMARALGIDSLSVREQAWRSGGAELEPEERTMMLDLDGDAIDVHETSDPNSHVRESRRNARAFVSTERVSAVTTGTMPRVEAPSGTANLGFWVAVATVGCLVVTALVVSFWPRAAPPVSTAQVFHVTSVPAPDPYEAARKQQALEEARASAEAAKRARVLSAQQARIDACFKRKPRAGEAPSGVELAFEVDAAGKAVAVDVVPETLATTTLGKCLRAVGKRARFASTGARATFSVMVAAGGAVAADPN